MKDQKRMLMDLMEWGKADANVRALLMTSSRANPHAFRDVFTDYDIEVFAEDLERFLKDDTWLKRFGDRMTTVPLIPRKNEGWITRLVMYMDGTRVDFQISTTESLKEIAQLEELPPHYDLGYKVLLDKDQIVEDMVTPSNKAFYVKKPTQDEFQELVNSYWWDTTYVAKSLWRDELFFAKYMLDNVMRFQYLQKILEWSLGVRFNWEVNPNKCGRWFKRYLDSETWQKLEATYAGADIEDNWNALFNMNNFFMELCRDVAGELGFECPEEVEMNITHYLTKVRELDPEAEEIEI
ncbi:aminoglycoside 6-adenylyltransferase [Guptibacillus algicola]|uniref:aminoglycoside 6-adenylyltransferase n=1 Tax=Guptibacillus algicola TaxID=225844 RepID=UPI001CD19CCC|nr:aminoglycoside 6-adenylyltransferase [Alkalihalobacillus algicola]MCA0987618.1 aminoglycoside 6-adenylyltransferase [Alkalihalobacillus algicola]